MQTKKDAGCLYHPKPRLAVAGNWGRRGCSVRLWVLTSIFWFTWVWAQAPSPTSVPDSSRVVSIGASVTEIVYALGAEHKLVGVDSGSNFPVAATRKPQVGYRRSLAVEGILSLGPTLILAVEDAGPPAVLAQLQNAGIPLVLIEDTPSPDGSKKKIKTIGQALGLEVRADALARRIDAGILVSKAMVARLRTRPKVVFLYSSATGQLTLSGRNTAADSMIALAGAINPIVSYSGYKPISAEALVQAQPDVIVILDRGLEAIGGIEGLLRVPGVAGTPAGRNRRFVSFDGVFLLGFGPRLGEAVQQLTWALHSELRRP